MEFIIYGFQWHCKSVHECCLLDSRCPLYGVSVNRGSTVLYIFYNIEGEIVDDVYIRKSCLLQA